MGDGRVVHIHSKEEWDAALQKAADEDSVVIVDFTATWCGPCRMIGPVFITHSSTYTKIIFLKVDVDEVPQVAEACKISAMPTFKVIKKKVVVDELVGANPAALEALIKNYN